MLNVGWDERSDSQHLSPNSATRVSLVTSPVPIRSIKLVLTLIVVVNTLINQVNMANRNSALYLEYSGF